MKKIITLVVVLLSIQAYSQHEKHTISGVVLAETEDEPFVLPGAFVRWIDKKSGVYTDSLGKFNIEHHHESPYLVFSFATYSTDTVLVQNMEAEMKVILIEENQLKGVVVRGKGIGYALSKLDPRTTVLLSEREFQKAACCNLSESFENAPAIDVSFSDAVTGTKQIKMLGLDGFYTMIGREYMPAVRTLNSYYGLSHIPAAWVDGIQITKGAGSVVNGYESIAGQINVELKKPYGDENFLLDQFASEGGRFETDFMYRKDINEHLATSVLARYGVRTIENDRNNDGFLDMPLSNDMKLMNRWQFHSESGIEGIATASYHKNEQRTGQLSFYNGDDNAYGIGINSEIVDAFAKIGKVFEGNEFKSLGSQFGYTYTDFNAGYGAAGSQQVYEAKSKQVYVNLLFQNIIGNSFHQYQTGLSFLYDNIDESYDGFVFQREEAVPGAFFEYTYKPKETLSIVGGIRADYNSIYGMSVTPRFHSKYRFNKEKTSIRTSAGIGRRTSNPLAQNQQLFASGRSLVFQMSDSSFPYGLQQEIAFNTGISFEHEFKLGYIPSTLGLDYFHSRFINEVVIDREIDALASIYNVENGTRAHSFQTQLDLQPARRTDIRLAYRMFDVETTYKPESVIGATLSRPFISRHRAFINVTQRTRTDWQFSTTATWYGPQRIPGYDYVGGPILVATNFSPSFYLWNAQVSKTFKNQFELYLGGENLLNFRQENPIQEAANPFDENFDAGLVWGPIFGRMIYGGFRWRIKGA